MSDSKVLKPRPYQKDAIEAAVEDLHRSDRTTVVMACGTGKTLVSQRIAEALIKDGSVVVALFPSIGLLDQTYRSWKQNSTNQFQAIAICSDETVGKEADGFKTEDLSIESTTSAEVLKDWVQEFSGSHRIIFATYQSSEVVQIAQDSMGMQEVDLIVFDEAHRTTGLTSKQFSTALDQKKVRASKRLFLTATPKVHSGKSDDTVYSMDDESIYGKVSYELTFAEAVRLGRLSDYRVAIVAVTEKEVHQAILDNPKMNVAGKELDVEMVASQIALGRAIQEYNLNRTIVFHNRIGKSKEFARSLPTTLGLVDESFTDRTNVVHMDAKTDTSKRVQELEKFVELGQEQIGVLSNVKVLSEGIDSPVIDSIMFSDPKTSYIEVAQAVGRAMRLHPTRKEPSIILLPVFVNPLESSEAAIDDSRFKHVWSTIRALADNDSKFASDLAFSRAGFTNGESAPLLPEKINFVSELGEVPESFSRSFAMKLIDATSSSWENGITELSLFVEKWNSGRIPVNHVSDSGFRLGSWSVTKRQERRAGLLSSTRIKALDDMGFDWNTFDTNWNNAIEDIKSFVGKNGHFNAPSGKIGKNGTNLRNWIASRRSEKVLGSLTKDRQDELDELGFTWSVMAESTDTLVSELKKFQIEFGHVDPPQRYKSPSGYPLGKLLSSSRGSYRDGTISRRRRSELESLGISWKPKEDRWGLAIRELENFINTNGHVWIPSGYISPSGFKLGSWASDVRRLSRSGKVTQERIHQLNSMEFIWERARKSK